MTSIGAEAAACADEEADEAEEADEDAEDLATVMAAFGSAYG